MSNYFSYERISTKEERGKQKFSRQDAALDRYAKDNGIDWTLQIREDESGKSFENRKEWKRLEKIVQADDTIVFKDISRFTREAENGYEKYMGLLSKGVELIFIDNPTVSTPYIKELLRVAKEQSLVAKVSLESTIKLLLIVELDRVEQERLTINKRIRDGIKASNKPSGRTRGKLDKMTAELHSDILHYLDDRSVKQSDLMKKHNISRNTLKKYIDLVKAEPTDE